MALGLLEDGQDINKARNNIISIIAYSIYISWVKCDESKMSYKYINIGKNIVNSINHYDNMYKKIVLKLPWGKHFHSMCHTLVAKLEDC